jgi:hypothetical protein
VRVVDERTLALPNYDGNAMYVPVGNAMATGEVGMLLAACLALRPVHNPGGGPRGVSQLPAAHPLLSAGRALEIRSPQDGPAPGSRLEAVRLGRRRAAGEGPGARTRHRRVGAAGGWARPFRSPRKWVEGRPGGDRRAGLARAGNRPSGG